MDDGTTTRTVPFKCFSFVDYTGPTRVKSARRHHLEGHTMSESPEAIRASIEQRFTQVARSPKRRRNSR